jgi:hypothetical protein
MAGNACRFPLLTVPARRLTGISPVGFRCVAARNAQKTLAEKNGERGMSSLR